MSSSESVEIAATCSTDDDSDVKRLTSAQKESVERNRQKANELRSNKRPPSHEPGNNVRIVPVKISKPVTAKKVIDSGGGFLIEEDLTSSGQSSSTQVKIVHEPGAILDDDRNICDECGKPFIESYLMNKFKKSVCDVCKDASETYKLITKTEAKSKYQLKDVDLDKREPILQFIVKKNPRHDQWGEMKLYLECQIAERAVEVHGSSDEIEKEKQKKIQKREKAQQKKFDKNVQALRMAVKASQPTKLHIGHKHEFGPDVYNSDSDQYTKTCKTCGHSVAFEKM